MAFKHYTFISHCTSFKWSTSSLLGFQNVPSFWGWVLVFSVPHIFPLGNCLCFLCSANLPGWLLCPPWVWNGETVNFQAYCHGGFQQWIETQRLSASAQWGRHLEPLVLARSYSSNRRRRSTDPSSLDTAQGDKPSPKWKQPFSRNAFLAAGIFEVGIAEIDAL